ncbi:hypothetical protein D9V41_16815, partial [Aeromicrobium phragmitis]
MALEVQSKRAPVREGDLLPLEVVCQSWVLHPELAEQVVQARQDGGLPFGSRTITAYYRVPIL